MNMKILLRFTVSHSSPVVAASEFKLFRSKLLKLQVFTFMRLGSAPPENISQILEYRTLRY